MAEVVDVIVVDNECLFPPKYFVRHFLKFDLEIIPSIYPLILYLWVIRLSKPLIS